MPESAYKHNTEIHHRENYRFPQEGQYPIITESTNFFAGALPVNLNHETHYQNHRTILALDLGTTMGYAVRGYTGTIFSDTVELKSQRIEEDGTVYLHFHRWLTEIKSLVSTLEEVYFEEVRQHPNITDAYTYGGFVAYLSSWCEQNEIPYGGIPAGTVNRHITGKDNATGEEIIQAVRAKGHDPKDANEADALSLLDFILTTNYQGNGL